MSRQDRQASAARSYIDRYALQLTDTIKIGQDKSICLTEGVKSAKDTLFFLSDEADEPKPAKKAPPKPATNGNSPMKNKTAGGKVLRNKTRSAAQQEVLQTAAAKIHEHQRELHEQLQTNGLAKYSEEGDGTSGKEGKSWKRFQSYKGEAALPKETESLRVRLIPSVMVVWSSTNTQYRFLLTAKRKPSSCLFMDLPYHSISTRSRMLARTRRASSHSYVLTSRPPANWPGKRKIL